MSDISNKDADDLLAEITGPETNQQPQPQRNQHSIQVLVVPPKGQSSGGRAFGNRPQTLAHQRQSPEELEYYEAEAEARKQFIASDPVVKNAAGKDPLAMLSAIKQEVAMESANLAFQREQASRRGRDTSSLSGRRIEALKKIADIELEMHKIGFESLDLHSEKIQRVFQLWIEMVREAAVETLGAEQLDLFFNRLTTAMDGWEEKASDLVR
jgi:hypothetical protein